MPVSTETPETEQVVDSSAAESADTVSVGIDSLILGRPLQNAIHDDNGVLLLAEGATVTSGFKRLLKNRGLAEVNLHVSDAQKLTLEAGPEMDFEDIGFDTELAKELDDVIDSGLLQVVNEGPSVRDQMVIHGRKAYDPEKHEHLVEQQKQTSQSLDNMMRGALKGQRIDANDVTQVTASFLSDMTADADCLLSVSSELGQSKDISDHCVEMSILGMALGVEMGLDGDNCRKIGVAGLVHDWGMLGVPAELRNADRRLTKLEYWEVMKHPIYTLEILEKTSGIPSMVPIVAYQVHERPNGTGYPRARINERIHQFARILNVADIYTALTSPRPYRQPLMPYGAMEYLLQLARTQMVDPEVVRALLNVLSLFPIGSFVTLNDGSVARVLRRNGGNYTAPIVRLIQDSKGDRIALKGDNAVIDLTDSDLAVAQALPTPGANEIASLDQQQDARK